LSIVRQYRIFLLYLLFIISLSIVANAGDCGKWCTDCTAYKQEVVVIRSCIPYPSYNWCCDEKYLVKYGTKLCQDLSWCDETLNCEADGDPYIKECDPYWKFLIKYNCGVEPSLSPIYEITGHVGVLDSAFVSTYLEPKKDSPLVVVLNWGGSDLDLTLYPPYGTIIRPRINSSSVVYFENTTYEGYRIRNPLPGYWIFEVKPIEVEISGEDYTVSVYQFPNGTNLPAKEDSHNETFLGDSMDRLNNKTIIHGVYSDYGVDVDEDGKYDSLAINATINVSLPGQYTLSGYLYDSNGSKVVWSIGGGFFEAGNHTVILDFDGKEIRKHGMNGSYYLKNLILSSGSSNANLTLCDIALHEYVTSMYNQLDFDD